MLSKRISKVSLLFMGLLSTSEAIQPANPLVQHHLVQLDDIARSSSDEEKQKQDEEDAVKNFDSGVNDKADKVKENEDSDYNKAEKNLHQHGLSWNALKNTPAGMKYKTAWDEPANLLPDFGFINNQGNEGHKEGLVTQDFPTMRVHTLRAGNGPLCEMNQWATVSWKAYISGEDPQLIHDSHKSMAGEGPRQFRIGNYQVSKCWDLAIQQMRKGDMVKLYCPAHLDQGGNINNFRQSGTSWIKKGTDLTYEMEVHECVSQLKLPDEVPIKPKKCFFMTLTGIGKNYALAAHTKDKYAPRKTGVYNVVLAEFTGTDSKDRNQMWWYDDKDHTVHSYAHDDTDAVLFEGFNRNLCLVKNLKRDNQKFGYNGNTKFWRNEFTKRAVAVAWADLGKGGNAVTYKIDENNTSLGNKWKTQYCDGSDPVF